jgi:hypothetical protein
MRRPTSPNWTSFIAPEALFLSANEPRGFCLPTTTAMKRCARPQEQVFGEMRWRKKEELNLSHSGLKFGSVYGQLGGNSDADLCFSHLDDWHHWNVCM